MTKCGSDCLHKLLNQNPINIAIYSPILLCSYSTTELINRPPMSDSPTSPPPPSPMEDDSTNTLILTGLPTELFVPDFLRQLRGLFASYGEINQWVPLRSLARIIIVYLYDEDSARAKHGAGELLCDETIGRYDFTLTSHCCVL